jgi:hypothetical protein
MLPGILVAFGLGALTAALANPRQDQAPAPPAPRPPALPPPQVTPNAAGLLAGDPLHSPTGSAQAPRAGVQSHPDYQWTYVVRTADESPGSIAAQVLGEAQGWRYVELLASNPQKPTKGAIVSPEPTEDELNFVDLKVGEKLAVPRSWNAWIDETGIPSGKSPYPAPRA